MTKKRRMKDWIIKKLGGATPSEYMVERYHFVPVCNPKIETICAEGAYDIFRYPPEDYVEKQLIFQLAKGLKPYVQWSREEDYGQMCVRIQARIKVVRADG